MKICVRCKAEKNENGFYSDNRMPGKFRAKCKSCMREIQKIDDSRPERKLAHKLYHNEDRGRNARRKYEMTEKGKVARSAINKRYRSCPKKRAKCTALFAKYRFAKVKATPEWLTKGDFELMDMKYELASYLTIETGIRWTVDHIVPLQGDNVCGLHVPWNLRVIPSSENSGKSNQVLSPR